MKKLVVLSLAGFMLATSCKKSNNNTSAVTETAVINDFVDVVVLKQYTQLQADATTLNTAVSALNTNPTGSNLDAARTAWRNVRGTWEGCEGFLIGPVEDDNYDPNMDTWPVDYHQLDSFITNTPSGSITVATVAGLSQSLRGFHPLEYILWGKGGNNTVDSINAKRKLYMVALSQDILTTCTNLNTSWAATGGNFQATFRTAGTGSTRYTTKHDAFLAIAAGMSDICDEVGSGKMYEPFIAIDSNITESPFSHNSITDFTNNLKGAQNVYLCSVNGTTGVSLSSFVATKNISLDNKLKTQYAAAIAAMGNITVSFEVAIYSQRTQLQTAMDAILALQKTIDEDLKAFIVTNVKD